MCARIRLAGGPPTSPKTLAGIAATRAGALGGHEIRLQAPHRQPKSFAPHAAPGETRLRCGNAQNGGYWWESCALLDPPAKPDWPWYTTWSRCRDVVGSDDNVDCRWVPRWRLGSSVFETLAVNGEGEPVINAGIR